MQAVLQVDLDARLSICRSSRTSWIPVQDEIKMEKDYADLLEGHKIEEVFELEYFNHTLTQGQIDAYNKIDLTE